MRGKIIQRLTLPKELEQDYWQQTIASNARIVMAVVSLCIAVQFFNLYRLLVLSERKLGTFNNRIYFGFYCSILLLCILYLAMHRVWAGSLKNLAYLQRAGFSVWLIWCTALNYYDLALARHSISTVIFVTALFGTAVCIQMVPWYAWINYLTIGSLFIIGAFPILEFGECWNLFVGVSMVLVISYARFSYAIKDIQNRNLIDMIHEELLEKTETLDLSLQKYNYILRQTNNIILDWDLESDTASFSGNWKSLFGLPAEITNFSCWLPPTSLISAESLADLMAELKSAAESGKELETEVMLTDSQGKDRWYSFRFKFQTDSHGARKSGLGYLEDISRHKQEIFRLESTAKTDPLTGLLNRQGLYEYFQEHLMLRDGYHKLAIILLDIDGFKNVNDIHGHPCGDQALIHLAQVLQKQFRRRDGIGRIGGDEFMAILPFTDDIPALCSKAEALLKQAPQFTWLGSSISLTFSIGIALWDNDSFETLYQKADIALYSVKHQNKGSYQIYKPGM